MKIQIQSVLGVITFISWTIISSAQGGNKITLSPEELKKEESIRIAANPLSKFSASQQKVAIERAHIIAVYLTKAILHRSDPAKYPNDGNNAMEKRTLDAISNLTSAQLSKAYSAVQGTLATPTKMENVYGKYKSIDFTIKELTPQLKKAGMTYTLDENKPKLMIAEDNKIRLMLRRVRCLDETNPESGDDDMIVGGILIGGSGKLHVAKTLMSCQMNDGDICNHGEYYFGGCGLSPGTYPKTFYCIFILGESDSDHQEGTEAFHSAIEALAYSAEGQSTDIHETALIVKQLCDFGLGLFTNEDYFPAEIVSLGMAGANSLGADNRSDNLTTPDIDGHGGKFRIGYFWRKMD